MNKYIEIYTTNNKYMIINDRKEYKSLQDYHG